jgi:hypothetical protein
MNWKEVGKREMYEHKARGSGEPEGTDHDLKRGQLE